jgi:prepilin-type N-terminal cleavage/methylation domain-containing protein
MNYELGIKDYGATKKCVRNSLSIIPNSCKFAGFTLIELLVVMAIIGMLLSAVSFLMSGARAKGRDARREEDMKQIQNALNLYVTNTGRFPICAEGVIDGKTDCLSATLISAKSTDVVSIDPLQGSTGTCNAAGSYIYCYQSANGSTYVLEYNLETSNIQGKTAGWQSVSP